MLVRLGTAECTWLIQKGPESVRFRGIRANYTNEIEVVACAPGNDKNAFGGYTGSVVSSPAVKGGII